MTSTDDRDQQTSPSPDATAHTKPQARARGAGAGAGPSNTAPANSKERRFLVLRKGVDSLYLSVQGQINTEYEARLNALKSAAQGSDPLIQGSAQITLLGHQFEVKGTGSRHFRFILQCPAYRIQVSSSSAKTLPLAYCQIKADYLFSKGVKAAAYEFKQIAEILGVVEDVPRISRADVFVDFLSQYALNDWGEESWVTRALKIDRHTVGVNMTGWSIGLGGEISARLYNKLLEIEKSGKTYLKPVWHQAGWEPDQPVYRLEFQFQQPQLKAHGVHSVPKLIEKLGPLWAYATQDWLRLACPNPRDKTKCRWPTHPLWIDLSSIQWGSSDATPSKPVRVKSGPSDERVFNYLFSAVTSYMALHNVPEPYDALQLCYAGLRESRESFGAWADLTFAQMAYDKAAYKACQWSLPFGDSAERSEHRQAEAVRALYRRTNKGRSDGAA